MIHFDYVAKIGTEIVMKDGKVIRPMRGTVKVLKKEYYDYIQWKSKNEFCESLMENVMYSANINVTTPTSSDKSYLKSKWGN